MKNTLSNKVKVGVLAGALGIASTGCGFMNPVNVGKMFSYKGPIGQFIDIAGQSESSKDYYASDEYKKMVREAEFLED